MMVITEAAPGSKPQMAVVSRKTRRRFSPQPSNGVHLARDFFVLLDFAGLSKPGLSASFFSLLFI
jgi:hypothetical protein